MMCSKFKNIIIEGDKRARSRYLKDKRLNHINEIYERIKIGSPLALRLLVYELKQDPVEGLLCLIEGINNNSKSSECALWLLKGLCRYQILSSQPEDDTKYRYVFGSSSRKATFMSRALFGFMKGSDLRIILDTLGSSTPVCKEFSFDENTDYLVVHVHDYTLPENTSVRDIVVNSLGKLGFELLCEGEVKLLSWGVQYGERTQP